MSNRGSGLKGVGQVCLQDEKGIRCSSIDIESSLHRRLCSSGGYSVVLPSLAPA